MSFMIGIAPSKKVRITNPNKPSIKRLSSLHQDSLMHVSGFLDGKSLARLEVTCKLFKNNNVLDDIAKKLLHEKLPNLSQSLQELNFKYMNMNNKSYKYAYHSLFCYPTISEITPRYKTASPTDYRYGNQIHYMTEKMFGSANIWFLINVLRFYKKYEITKGNDLQSDHFMERFFRFGDKIDHYTQPELRVSFAKKKNKFIASTKLYLLKYHPELIIQNSNFELFYNAFIHREMINNLEDGLMDLAVEYRKMGAAICPSTASSDHYSALFKKLSVLYWNDFFWMDLKDPGHANSNLLQKKLDGRIAVYKIGKISDEEKLKKLEDITQNNYYSDKQLSEFAKKLIKLDAVHDDIKWELQIWIDAVDN